MNIKRCNNGHFYDVDKFASCPHCNSTVSALEDENNMAIADEFFQKYKSLAKEDNVEAFEYLQKAANLQHKEAVERIIDLYMRGHCIECIRRPALKAAAKEWKNPEKGISYGLEVEKRGINVAWNLMWAYESIENYEQTLYWAKIHDSRHGKTDAVERMAKEAQNMLSEGVKCYNQNDYEQALILFEKAAELGLSSAQYNCGIMYNNGEGTKVNKEKSLYWFEKAAEQGQSKAQKICAERYMYGDGTLPDADQALYWFKEATKAGEDETVTKNISVLEKLVDDINSVKNGTSRIDCMISNYSNLSKAERDDLRNSLDSMTNRQTAAYFYYNAVSVAKGIDVLKNDEDKKLTRDFTKKLIKDAFELSQK